MNNKIDVHTHIFPKVIPNFKERFGYGGFGCMEHTTSGRAQMMWDDGRFIRSLEENSWEPLSRFKDCDAHGVRLQVLSTVPFMFSLHAKPKDALEIARFLNDDLASTIQKHPKRFLGLGMVPLQDTDLAILEMRRCVNELGFCGIQIGTHANERNFSDPSLFAFFQEAQTLNAAIFIHPWDMMGADQMPRYWLPWLVGMPAEASRAICSLIFGGVFDRLPTLRVGVAHAGGAFPGTIGRIEQGFHARPDLCQVDSKSNPRDFCGRFWVDSLTHDAQMLKYVVDLLGSRKVMLGTDYPFPLGEARAGELIQSITDFTENQKDDLFFKSALDFLGERARTVYDSTIHH